MPKERIELSTSASLYCIYKYGALTDCATRAVFIFASKFDFIHKMFVYLTQEKF